MKLVEMNWNPTERQLRQFGVGALVVLPLLTWLLSGRPTTDWTRGQVISVGCLAALGGLLAGMALFRPRTLRPVFLGACLVALPIGLVVGELMMLVIYYGLFTPVGLVFRLIGRDPLQRAFDRQAATYWQPKAQPAGVRQYFRQS